MDKENIGQKIKITKDGPYIVSGKVPIHEKIIVQKGREYELNEGRELPQSESYALCRCGKSKTAPFCDGTHLKTGFCGEETASKSEYHKRAELTEGSGIDLLDDGRCAFARFCHRKNGNAWDLAENSDTEDNRAEAIQAACDCPAGRLTAVDKDGTEHEPVSEPSIDIVQDPGKGVSAGIFVKGSIPIESADGTMYETRNRVALCRCGKSENKPFCDASHVVQRYLDK
ncbi:CDGSH iron-sulfur domain-containing protein [Clostridium sp. KNHs216]|uniref:CDGSH iron-sulfur domain-containing protein n=1 Tax=Clostridium sp. KNHs216 TaxID=1550235 RepID=UPI00114DBC22|nr:CDGSH iron-sulfur domain-containing protein [Clostridium sp. KNHs216]TQI69099.1 CDGSH-type Zn-finger protein [Clostridium sp. KNHs216]